MNNFIMVQKDLISKGLKGNCLNLFLMMLDRRNLSEKNGWKDENGRTYIIMRVQEICEKLSVCKRTASSLLGCLEEAALISRKKQGLGKPNLIFITYQAAQCDSNIAQDSDNVNNNQENNCNNDFYMSWWEKFLSESEGLNEDSEYQSGIRLDTDINDDSMSMRAESDGIDNEDGSENFSAYEHDRSSVHVKKCRKMHFKKCKKMHYNNNINYNNINSSVCNITNQSYHQMDDEVYRAECVNTFKTNIDYDLLVKSSNAPELLELITDAVSDVVGYSDSSSNMRVAGKVVKKADVCRRLMQLDSQHAEYVIECIQGTSVPIRNPKAYMLTCLYNAPDTINAYYMLQAKTDMNRQTYGF